MVQTGLDPNRNTDISSKRNKHQVKPTTHSTTTIMFSPDGGPATDLSSAVSRSRQRCHRHQCLPSWVAASPPHAPFTLSACKRPFPLSCSHIQRHRFISICIVDTPGWPVWQQSNQWCHRQTWLLSESQFYFLYWVWCWVLGYLIFLNPDLGWAGPFYSCTWWPL